MSSSPIIPSSDLYSMSMAAQGLYRLLVIARCDMLRQRDLSMALIRYMIRVRKVKGGGSRESGSKNWMARYSRAYLRK